MARAALPVLAILVFSTMLAATIAVSGDTFGYDFLAYHLAGQRVLDGGPLFDLSYDEVGFFGLFYYPPTFAIAAVPMALLPADVATWAWLVGLIGAFLAGVAILPVDRPVKWAIVLLAGLSWPFVYAIKLGQVGPLLFLAFAVGWRWLRNDAVLGVSAAIGAAIKVQPGIVLAWALLRGRWRAVGWGAGVLVLVAVVATLIAGLGAWADYVELARRFSDTVTHPNSVTPGAALFRLGVPQGAAAAVQLASMVVVVVILLVGIRRSSEEASYLSVVVASQFLSPVLWDHYALLLLLPTAWLLQRRHWWAVLIPLASPVVLVAVIPPLVYPVVFSVALVAPLWIGREVGGAAVVGGAADGAGRAADDSGRAADDSAAAGRADPVATGAGRVANNSAAADGAGRVADGSAR